MCLFREIVLFAEKELGSKLDFMIETPILSIKLKAKSKRYERRCSQVLDLDARVV